MKKSNEAKNGLIETAFYIYEAAWVLFSPFLKLNKRIKETYSEKKDNFETLPECDIWFLSASAGEAYLTRQVLKQFSPRSNLKILLTAQTIQGLEILDGIAKTNNNSRLSVYTAFFPFDTPSLMERIVKKINPKIAVFIELEIWPGFMRALKKNNTRSIIINGRLTERSLKRYIKFPGLWNDLTPDRILAMSQEDEKRFKILFPASKVDYVPNIKFDRTDLQNENFNNKNNEIPGIPEERAFVILGSVRKEEEKKVLFIIKTLIKQHPDIIIGLFPRHMDRIDSWGSILKTNSVSYLKKSSIKETDKIPSVILWDKFGELCKAYYSASAAFLGGSLVPLGGQNVLEPLFSGVIPVTGKYYDNFSWAAEIMHKNGLLKIGSDENEVAAQLSDNILKQEAKEIVIEKAKNILSQLRGGTEITCDEIDDLLKKGIK